MILTYPLVLGFYQKPLVTEQIIAIQRVNLISCFKKLLTQQISF